MFIDCDQHLYESRTTWAEHIDPAWREEALAIVDDELGYPWLTWRGQRLQVADVQHPRQTEALGRLRQRRRQGLPPEASYDEDLPTAYWEPAARAEQVAAMGLDQAVLFPNFGLLWERPLSASLEALTANMGAWNRWCATVAEEGKGRLHPVAHLTLRHPEWLLSQLRHLSRAGVHLAMIAPALVDGRPLSHPEHDRLWDAFVDNGVTPVFHVANQPRVFDDAWYTDPGENLVPVMESVFLWTPPALAVTDLIVNGTLQRHPGLRIGVIELGAIWVPLYLLMLDGGYDFTARLNGGPLVALQDKPSHYFRRQVRVASFSFERPTKLIHQAGDIFMACSDYPHSEGTATPLQDYLQTATDPAKEAGLFERNVRFLLGQAA
ncbi:MAG TPA: hypothetical protein VKY15_07200 [Acidimicrobiales bacterium]|nr:hypothetical protein [Acidimicrobiales bacterium]